MEIDIIIIKVLIGKIGKTAKARAISPQKNQVTFSMAKGNEKLMGECWSNHLHMVTA